MKTYHGWVDDGGNVNVTVVEPEAHAEPLRLDPVTALCGHTSGAMGWGSRSPQSAQLALAIIADALGPQDALRLHQSFKRVWVANLARGDSWMISLSALMPILMALDVEVMHDELEKV